MYMTTTTGKYKNNKIKKKHMIWSEEYSARFRDHVFHYYNMNLTDTSNRYFRTIKQKSLSNNLIIWCESCTRTWTRLVNYYVISSARIFWKMFLLIFLTQSLTQKESPSSDSIFAINTEFIRILTYGTYDNIYLRTLFSIIKIFYTPFR